MVPLIRIRTADRLLTQFAAGDLILWNSGRLRAIRDQTFLLWDVLLKPGAILQLSEELSLVERLRTEHEARTFIGTLTQQNGMTVAILERITAERIFFRVTQPSHRVRDRRRLR